MRPAWPKSLNGLLLSYETALLLLVVVTGAIGGLWAYFWAQSSRESVRLNALLFDAQQIRGDLYSQLKLVNRAVLLGETADVSEYKGLARHIQQRFADLEEHLKGYRERIAANYMRRTFDSVETDMASLVQHPGSYPHASQSHILDPTYEHWMLADFESAQWIFSQVLAGRRQVLERQLNYWTTLAPWLIGLPILLALSLVLLSRYSLQRGVLRPLRQLIGAVRQLGSELRTTPLAEQGVTEVAGLAAAFNQLSRDLVASRKALAASERQAAQGALVPVVAHNIRNPLASIRAAAQLIDGAEDSAELAETRTEIVATVDRLERWVGALLAYLHPLRLQRQPVALTRIVDGALQPLASKLAARKLRLRRAGWSADMDVVADTELLEQAVYGLLNNAVDASPVGAELAVSLHRQVDTAELWVEDRGPGLPFEPQPDGLRPGPTTKRYGTGLGIPFAFKVLQAHDGGLIFDPRPGGGTRARLWLPLADQQETTAV